MSGTTSPDAIYYATTGDPVDPANESSLQASSIQTVLTARQIRTYKWANTAAKTAQTGMSEGDIGDQADIDQRWRYSGTAWVRGDVANLQLDTTNTTPIMVTQYGIGKITGNGTGVLTEAVTFPTAFAAGITPVINTTNAGVRATGAFNPASLGAGGFIPTGTYGVSNTSFTVRFDSGAATMGAANDFYYAWAATGKL